MNQEGIVLATPPGKYAGDRRPGESAAFAHAHGGLTAPPPTSNAGSIGPDHDAWTPVE